MHLAAPASGVGRLAAAAGRPPYWAYVWGGGAALARHVLDRPETVRGRCVLDLGAGCGIVAIASALAGARSVTAAELDPNGRAAIGLNAVLNGAAVKVVAEDLTLGNPPRVDLILAGDVFYAPDVAARVEAFLDRCLGAGIRVLVGDPGREPLPRARLERIADYPVSDFGDAAGSPPSGASVYAFRTASGLEAVSS